MVAVRIVIPGEAVAKGRPRVTRTGHAFTPEKTASYESYVRWIAVEAMKDHKRFEDEPLSVHVLVDIEPPESWSEKKKRAALEGAIQPAKRPDLDNVLKALTDAMNGITYKDDALICILSARKRYAAKAQVVIDVEPCAAPAQLRMAV